MKSLLDSTMTKVNLDSKIDHPEKERDWYVEIHAGMDFDGNAMKVAGSCDDDGPRKGTKTS